MIVTGYLTDIEVSGSIATVTVDTPDGTVYATAETRLLLESVAQALPDGWEGRLIDADVDGAMLIAWEPAT